MSMGTIINFCQDLVVFHLVGEVATVELDFQGKLDMHELHKAISIDDQNSNLPSSSFNSSYLALFRRNCDAMRPGRFLTEN